MLLPAPTAVTDHERNFNACTRNYMMARRKFTAWPTHRSSHNPSITRSHPPASPPCAHPSARRQPCQWAPPHEACCRGIMAPTARHRATTANKRSKTKKKHRAVGPGFELPPSSLQAGAFTDRLFRFQEEGAAQNFEYKIVGARNAIGCSTLGRLQWARSSQARRVFQPMRPSAHAKRPQLPC